MLGARLHWLNELVKLLEVLLIVPLLVLGHVAGARNLPALELDPALLTLVVLEGRLHLDHLLQGKDHLGREPTSDASLETRQ